MASDLTISFQGLAGAYSHKAIAECYPRARALPCDSFESALRAVQDGKADYAMTPIENSIYGRVPDIHRLLPQSGLHIIGEHYVRVEISLLGVKGVSLAQVKSARSHPVLLGQCAAFLQKHGIKPVADGDTAGAAKRIAEGGDNSQAALASSFAAGLYDLDVLAENLEDHRHNTTRFLIIARESGFVGYSGGDFKTSFIFRVRNIPAALYKALGGFATNGVNMVKLESYMIDGSFSATQFYADIIGHPEQEEVKRALDELDYYTDMVKVLGVYKAGQKLD